MAILTTATFNATTVNAATVRFGATGTEAAPVKYALHLLGRSAPDVRLPLVPVGEGTRASVRRAMVRNATSGRVPGRNSYESGAR